MPSRKWDSDTLELSSTLNGIHKATDVIDSFPGSTSAKLYIWYQAIRSTYMTISSSLSRNLLTIAEGLKTRWRSRYLYNSVFFALLTFDTVYIKYTPNTITQPIAKFLFLGRGFYNLII